MDTGETKRISTGDTPEALDWIKMHGGFSDLKHGFGKTHQNSDSMSKYDIQIKIYADYREQYPRPRKVCQEPGLCMMTSSNGNIICVTGHFVRGIHQSRWIPRTKASDAELWCFLHLRLNKRLSKQPRGWWFETPPLSLWRQYNDLTAPGQVYLTKRPRPWVPWPAILHRS